MKNLIFLFLLGFLTACTPLFISQHDLAKQRYSRGSYRGSYYIVKEGDTLHYIAYITDRNINEIIKANTILDPNKIYSGQKLNLWHQKYVAPAYGTKQKASFSKGNLKTASSISGTKKILRNDTVKYKKTKASNRNSSNKCVNHFGEAPIYCDEELNWQWPTTGKVISAFSGADFGNKGIDIAGQKGQPIKATANGKVVYAGSALRGYGNLIIIKHSDNFLSAYAHNESLLVKEKQSVNQGDEIATMGSSGTDTVRLHFEIRYKGKSVNPKDYLPEV